MALTSIGKKYLEKRKQHISYSNNSTVIKFDSYTRGYPNGDKRMSAKEADKNILTMFEKWHV